MNEERAETALRRLLEEAKRDPGPELDFDAIEGRLLSRVARGEGEPVRTDTSRPRWRGAPWALAASLAAAAAVGLVLRARSPAPSAPTHVAEAGHRDEAAPGRLDGSALAVGAVVTAGTSAVSVEHKDHVVWELAPNGIARLEAVGEVVGIALERGTVSAHVTRSPRPESFVVRVEHTRVAVHGTKFRVERLEGRVRVVVDEGVVAVGPVGGRPFEVFAPGSVVVSFDGVREGASGAAALPQVPAALVPEAVEAAGRPKNSATRAEPPVGPGRPPESAAPGVERVIQAVRHCLSEHTVARGDLRVTVRTRMTLRVRATGQVGEALFDPPLAPAVQGCVDAEVGAIRFSKSEGGFALDRAIELER